MRRMITNKQVVDVVNKAIDDGEIEVGALPEIESGDAGKVLKVNEQEDGVEWGEAGGADNALVLPEVAPASQQLVGVNTSNEQNSLGIGEGLEVANGELTAPYEIIKLDFNNTTEITISDQLYQKLYGTSNTKYQYILFVYNKGNNTPSIFTQYNNDTYRSIVAPASNAASMSMGNLKFGLKDGYKLTLSGNEGARKITLASENSSRLVSLVEINSFQFTALTGTKTGGQSSFSLFTFPSACLSYVEVLNEIVVALHPTYMTIESSQSHLYAEGQSATYKYSMHWNLTTGAYTITQTSI